MAKKILLADDDASLRELLKARLEANGYEVLLAAGGKEALQIVSAKKPDLILLDIMMPDMSGEEVMRKISTDGEVGFIPVIFITARDTKVKGLELGAMDYVQKPFDSDELLARIRVQLRIKELRDALTHLSITDYLTGCHNRRHALAVLEAEIKKSKRYGIALSCVMMDVNEFKMLNDTHGHDFGDVVLKGVAELLRKTVRDVDIVSRYGGDEFLLVLPNTAAESARALCERIAATFSAHQFQNGRIVKKVSLSMGVASVADKRAKDAESLIKLADTALYEHKRTGRPAAEDAR